jgi:putative NADH-flavin reductase
MGRTCGPLIKSPAGRLKGTRAIIDGVKKAGVKRLLFVGGSGSLEVKSGVQGVDLPGFPAQYKQGALATREALNMLRQETRLDWSVLSLSADLFPGERTGRFGRFQLGTDELLRDANGESHPVVVQVHPERDMVGPWDNGTTSSLSSQQGEWAGPLEPPT